MTFSVASVVTACSYHPPDPASIPVNISIELTVEGFRCRALRRKKIHVVPVSYREKIRVGRSEIIFFLNIFFMVLPVFCWAICSRVPTSILTRDAHFPWTNLGNLVQ